MPNILAIETSFPAASIALHTNEARCIQKNFESHRQQNQLLFPPLKQLLATLTDGEKIDLILVGTGPGSYSGSRISIAAAQGIAIAHNCPVIGVPSFLATKTWLNGSATTAVGDARRGAFFIVHIPELGLPGSTTLLDRNAFDLDLAETTNGIFTLDATMTLTDDAALPLEHPTAEKMIEAWSLLTPELQKILRETPPSPIYLRGPFITKAKPGHPLLRGKVKASKPSHSKLSPPSSNP